MASSRTVHPAAILTLALLFAAGGTQADTIIEFDTIAGSFQVQLYDAAAPITVTNFLSHIQDEDYVNSFFHRSIPGFVLQGGGFRADLAANQAVTPLSLRSISGPAIRNEFDSLRSNVRGTIAMAKVGGDPNSATTQFFFNLNDNSENLDEQNGGFTVFGEVIDNGMDVVDRLAGRLQGAPVVEIWNGSTLWTGASGSNPYGEIPFVDYQVGNTLVRDNLAMVYSIDVVGQAQMQSISVARASAGRVAVNPALVPEPATLALLACGALAMLRRTS